MVLGIMAACAQEGPYVAGKAECDFSVSAVSSTMAVISASLPKNDNFFYEIDYYGLYLTENRADEAFSMGREDLIEGECDYDESDEFQVKKLFSNLKPNTTYYPVVNVNSTLNGPDTASDFLYNSGFSFKTLPSDPNDPNDPNADYMSILSTILKNNTTLEVTHYAFGYAQIKLTLPEDIDFIKRSGSATQLRVSTTPDMKDFKSYNIWINDDPIGDHGHYGCVTIDMSESKKYYFEIVSALDLYCKYDDWFPYWDESKEVTIRIENPIDSATLQEEASISEVTCTLMDYKAKIFRYNWDDSDYEYFTIVRVNMPSNVKIENYANFHYFSECNKMVSLKAISISDSDNVEKALFNDQYETYPYNNLGNYDCKPNEYLFAFSVLKKDKYQLKLNCCVNVSSETDSKSFIIDDITINVANILDLINVSDD